MKHIKTASDAETSMRKTYPDMVDQSPVTAGKEHENSIVRILELTRQKDLLELEISTERGKLMGYMQGHAALVDGKGLVLATWIPGATRTNVDWEAVVRDAHVPEETVLKHTSQKRSSRTFTVCADLTDPSSAAPETPEGT